MLSWQPFLAFYILGAPRRHLKNATELSMCGGDAALCQITFDHVFFISGHIRLASIIFTRLHHETFLSHVK